MPNRRAAPIPPRYKWIKKLGQGGFAEVWLASDTVLQRYVAIKLPRDPTDATSNSLLWQEAQLASRLFNHPNVVAVLDLFTYPVGGCDVPAVVMEYVDGSDARTFAKRYLARRRDALTRTAVALHVTYSAACALQFAHESGIVHRDVKPGNVLVGHAGAVKLADFGLAKVRTQATRTHTGKGARTFLYCAPEQVAGGPASRETDLYQLGCMLYELLECRAPNEDAPDAASLALKKLVEAPPDPMAMGGLTLDEKKAIVDLYRGLMAKNPGDRVSAGRCGEELSRILHRCAWRLRLRSNAATMPVAIAEVMEAVTGELIVPRGVKPAPAVVDAAGTYLEFQDAHEALAETMVLLLRGVSPYVYLERCK